MASTGTGCPDDLAPFGKVCLDQCRIFLRRTPLNFDAGGLQSGSHIGRLQRGVDLRIEFRNDWPGGTCGREEATIRIGIVALEPLFVRGRYTRQGGCPLAGATDLLPH